MHMKHPVILAKSHRYTTQLVQELHLDNLHAGPTLLVASLNQRYWLMRCQSVVRRLIQNCVRCYRMKVKTATQLMGSLPAVRTTLVRAFLYVGVDYAGRIILKSGNPRKPLLTKGYIVVFVFQRRPYTLRYQVIYLPRLSFAHSSDSLHGAACVLKSGRTMASTLLVLTDSCRNSSHPTNSSQYPSNTGIK